MRSLYPSPLEYVAIVNDFTHVLADNKEYRDEMLSSGLIDFWLEMNVRQADNDGNHSSEERTASIAFLADLWVLFTDKLYQREDLANQMLKVFKRASRDKYRPLRITALSQMFRLLDTFSRTKNSYAPSIYKAIAMSLVENHSDATTREFIMQNLEQIFEIQPTIPVGFVVEPLVNQLQMAEGVSYHYNSVDFQFFVAIAKHPKLHAQQAIPLIDILAKIYLNDQSYAQCCSRPLLMLISRFVNDNGVREFLVKFLTVSLSMLLALEKGKGNKKIKIPTTMTINSKPSNPKESKEEKEINRSLKKTFIIEIARNIQKLRHAYVNAQMKNLVMSTNKRNNEIHGQDNVGCLVLLKFWGDPKAIMDEFMKDEVEREKKEAQEQEKNQQLVLADDIDPGNASAIEGVNNRNSMEIVPYSDYGNRMSRDSKRGALVPWSKLKPKGKIGRKAMHEIERLQKSRRDREEFRKLQEKQERMREEKSKKRLADELEKRKIEYGVNDMNKNNAGRKIIFDEGEVDKFKMKEKKHGLPEIELFDFEEEEQRDVEAIKLFMKKYAKLWKFFFNKYANMCFSAKHIRNFDQLNDKHNTINLAELLKLLSDHDFDKRYITKEEVAAILRLVNFKKIKKNDLTAMDYPGFLEWIIQTAIYIFTKPPEDKSHFPPVECLHAFLRKLEKAEKAKGGSTILFEDPDATSIGDSTLLNALNKKIKEDPNYPIPEGYKKVKEKDIIYDYKLPDYIPIDPAKKFCMELLDDLINKQFEFHFLEPIITYKETLKVKPIIRKQFKDEAEGRATPRYLQSLDKRQKPKELTDKGKMSAYQKMRQNKQRPPKLREVLALEVAKFDIADRAHAQETAEALEEILLAAERGYKELPNREKYGPMGIQNPVLLDNQNKQKEEQKIQKDREDKRQQRDQFIKNKIKKKDEEKRKLLADTKDERMKKKEIKKKKKQEDQAKKEKEQAQRQKEYEEKKKQEMELLDKKRQEEEAREKAKKEKFEKENKAFLKEQRRKIKKQFKEMIKEKESIQKAEKEYEEMNQKLQETLKKRMEKFFEENKENLKKDKEEKQAINKFLKNEAVATMFDSYQTQLRYFFDHYAKSEHHELTRDIEKEWETLNYKEFINFMYENNVINTLIPIQEVIYIFHQLVRERTDEDRTANQAIDFEYFKKALVRIAVVGQTLLGGEKGPEFEKKMEELKQKEEEDKARKEKLAKKASLISPKKLAKQKTDKDDLERDETSPAAEKRDPKKSTVRKEGSLMERGAKPPREKIIIPNPKEEKLKSATLIKGKIDENLLLTKKSQSINKLLEIDSRAQVVANLQKVKVDNTRVTTECDVGIISAKTIEALLKHIGLEPVEHTGESQKLTTELRLEMDRKLNSRRKDVQGAVPNRVRKMNMINQQSSAQVDDAVSEEDNEEEGSEDEEEEPKAKKTTKEDTKDKKDAKKDTEAVDDKKDKKK